MYPHSSWWQRQEKLTSASSPGPRAILHPYLSEVASWELQAGSDHQHVWSTGTELCRLEFKSSNLKQAIQQGNLHSVSQESRDVRSGQPLGKYMLASEPGRPAPSFSQATPQPKVVLKGEEETQVPSAFPPTLPSLPTNFKGPWHRARGKRASKQTSNPSAMLSTP